MVRIGNQVTICRGERFFRSQHSTFLLRPQHGAEQENYKK